MSTVLAWAREPAWALEGFREGYTVSMRGRGVPQGAVRIDRRSRWGNPFPLRPSATEAERAEVVELYRAHLMRMVMEGRVTIKQLAALDGKQLACWCAPKRCHGDVLALAAKWASEVMSANDVEWNPTNWRPESRRCCMT